MTKRDLFLDGWRFKKLPLDADYNTALEQLENFEEVSLPHDWLIYNVNNLYEDSKGFYEKTFRLEKEKGKRYEIYFEGVYMDTTVYLNGAKLGEWKYGYSSFFFDMTNLLVSGENQLVVEIKHQSPNSRWYSGAGIFRDVYFIEKDTLAFVTDSVYISSRKTTGYKWITDCCVECQGIPQMNDELKIELFDYKGRMVATKSSTNIIKVSREDGSTKTLEDSIEITNPALWNITYPLLYTCRLSWLRQGKVLDQIDTKIGFKELRFDPNEGLFLNNKHVKLNGVCEHHDFGALGSVFNKNALRRKFEILKDMGVNAIRSAHNMPAVGLLELADEMGFLVIDEAFDMWERSKTDYDYARFFKAWYSRDVRSWVRRDRNHVCLLFWSIGNEIYDTHASDRGQEVTKLLKDAVEKHDYHKNAHASIGSNYMPWGNAQKCADILKYAGYNYGERYYHEHHDIHHDWIIYGSETASTVQSRGIYKFPYKQPMLSDDDEQCSSLGNCTTSWGADNAEYCIRSDRDAKFSLGQFIWTGFDYIGEPTPYHTKNSYFGQLDTAGFPKDNYYIYRAEWSKQNTTHVFPYWNWNENQLIDVRVATNAPLVELFVNGKSQGLQEIDHQNGKILTGNWVVPYEEGEIVAVSYDKDKNEIGRDVRHSFGDTKQLKLSAYSDVLFERDAVAYISIEALDKDGYLVENANDRIIVNVVNGTILGMDNGDSTDEDEYKTNNKRLFGGKLMLLVAPDGKGDIKVSAKALETDEAKIIVPVKVEHNMTVLSRLPEKISTDIKENNCWVREIKLHAPQGQKFSRALTEMIVTASILPQQAAASIKAEDIIWKAVTDSGIESSLVKLEPDGLKVHIKALGDGQFKLRCMVKNGCKQVKVISSLEFYIEDLGIAYTNPYNFVAGGLYSYSEGDIGNGNEHGVSTAREGRSVVGFENINFGDFGSNEITIPIFELGSEPTPIQIWEGIPGKHASTLLADVIYDKKSIWNVYQPETYTLSKRLKGITSIYFVGNSKFHIKGFEFTKQIKAFEKLYAAECDNVYGDEFTIEDKQINKIGNNVSIEFSEMDFGNNGISKVTICGKTPNDKNSIHIMFEGEQNRRDIIEFTGNTQKEMTFDIEKVTGKQKVTFVFLPGSNFDFNYFIFS